MSSRRSVGGFTLVELLVVISIIGMLMALLLPAVQSAREAGRRNTCSNNEKNVATAMINFDSTRRYFPGYANQINAVNPTAGTSATYFVGYVVPLLPYLERNDLYRTYTDASQVASSVYQAILVCPSNPPTTIGGPQLAYVINGGWDSQTTGTSNPNTTGISAAVNVAETAANGVCFNAGNSAYTASLSPVKVGSDYVSSNDGATYTALLSENNQANFWTFMTGNNASVTATLGGTDTLAPYMKKFNTFVWFAAGMTNGTNVTAPPVSEGSFPTTTLFRINSNKATAQATTTTSTTYGIGYARPSSNHTGGVNMFFCDGHYRFIAEDINYLVLRQLMTSNYQNAYNFKQQTTAGSTYYNCLPLDDSMY